MIEAQVELQIDAPKGKQSALAVMNFACGPIPGYEFFVGTHPEEGVMVQVTHRYFDEAGALHLNTEEIQLDDAGMEFLVKAGWHIEPDEGHES
jgi:hypothetical protein